MAKLKIVKVPEKLLREKSRKVLKVDKKINRLIKNMIETMYSVGGLGISAPQVGHLLKIAIIESKGGKRKNGENMPIIPLTIIINPEIKKYSQKKCKREEGCLSVPDIWGEVERPESVIIEYEDTQKNKKIIKASGLFARALQHEIDHLNGIIFTDKADYATLHKIDHQGKKISLNFNG